MRRSLGNRCIYLSMSECVRRKLTRSYAVSESLSQRSMRLVRLWRMFSFRLPRSMAEQISSSGRHEFRPRMNTDETRIGQSKGGIVVFLLSVHLWLLGLM